MQGWRVTMEDAHATVLDLEKIAAAAGSTENSTGGTNAEAAAPKERVAFFGVYDGHGGDRAALFTGEHLHKIVARQPTFGLQDWGQALKDGFLSTDRAVLREGNGDPSGCAATTALVAGNKIVVANAGDSRTILAVKGVAKPLSFDHKPQNEGERARICAAGGFVDMERVNGNLALSRAIGDFDFKKSANLPPEEQIVTAYPDVMEHTVTPDDEFLVLACDGIWDCMKSQEVVEFVRRGVAEGLELDKICEKLMDNCLAPESDMTGIGCDNMTVLIVALLNGQTKEQWYDTIAERVKNGDGPVASISVADLKGSAFTRQQDEVMPGGGNHGGHAGGQGGAAGLPTPLSLHHIFSQGAEIQTANGTYILQPHDGASVLARMGLQVDGDDDDVYEDDERIVEATEVEEPASNDSSAAEVRLTQEEPADGPAAATEATATSSVADKHE